VRQDDEDDHEIVILDSPGYSAVKLPVSVEEGENLRSALQRIKENVVVEIGRYYQFVQMRNHHMTRWWELNSQIKRLVDQAKGTSPRWGRKYGRAWRQAVESVSLDLAYLKVEIEDTIREVERDITDISRSFGLANFSSYTHKVVEELREYPIQDILGVVKTLEERSNLQQINTAVIVAGVIGGAAGLIAGFLSATIALYTASPG
jgi:hypothetical protein